MNLQMSLGENLPNNEDFKYGFYLDKLELYNWGTFHNKIWRITPGMDPSLITGDFGSGKSTIVDAITALLVPPSKIVFNKSAGADKQERSFNSYILGHYKSESNEGSRKGHKKGLRENRKSFTSLLAVFKNQETRKAVTLAQIMTPRPKGDNRTPDKIFIVSEKELSTREHIGSEYAKKGKKKYKQWITQEEKIQLFDSFSSYSDSFRRLLYLKNHQALDLFHKAISLKQIENLTTFVRNHMLEEHDVKEKISELCSSYEQLNELHDIVVKERKQVEHLTIISDYNTGYIENKKKEELAREARSSSEKYFAKLKVEKYTEKIEELKKKVIVTEKEITEIEEKTEENEIELENLKTKIISEGGTQADDLKQKIRELEASIDKRKSKAARYQELSSRLGLELPTSEGSFHDNLQSLRNIVSISKDEQKELKAKYNLDIISFNKIKEIASDIEKEIDSLQRRKSNIPHNISHIRDEMLDKLGIGKGDLPFAGELVKVKKKEKKWEGAIEKVLRNFGLSILVPENLYPKVSHYVDQTYLRGKIIYLRMPNSKQAVRHRSPKEESSLAFKIEINEDIAFYEWIWEQICQKFDYACTTTIEDFRRKEKAITINGQIKSNRSRHEKDDRKFVNDRSNYILGWENKEKIKEFKEILRKEQRSAQELSNKISDINDKEKNIQDKIINASGLIEFSSYSETDWNSLSIQIHSRKSELKKIESVENSSCVIKQLRTKERELKERKKVIKAKENNLREERTKAQQFLEIYLKDREREDSKIKHITNKEVTVLFPIVEKIYRDCSRNKEIEGAERFVTSELTKRVEGISRVRDGKRREMEKKMESFKLIWPQDSYELEATINGIEEFLQRMNKLERDQLPEHERKFKEKLRTDTINNVAIFKSQLESHKNSIEERITAINNSLKSVNFSPSTYIQLLYQSTNDEEIRAFREQLRIVLSDRFTENLYAEEKYLQIKELIEKFKGQEGRSDQDRKWTQKVTNVRNWFTFAASEKFQDTNEEKEYYPDSGGKSGGEKERLAYTVLASALLYQYGESFKFVIIDEAFGKGSEESARFGMELFRELGLQLLVITPLQKINVIEKYIKKVHFVRKVNNLESYVDDWTIEEYQKKKEEYLQNEGTRRNQEKGLEFI